MEMHQIRYFLAVAKTLNFTRAAEECHVAQPSLTRAIKLLEEELGGDLFRRERNHSHLTELGSRMLPFLRQSYEGAQSAREMARSLKKGETAPLKLALSGTVPIELLVDSLMEVQRTFAGLELRILRGSASEIVEIVKRGDADLLVAGPLLEDWDRFDRWPLLAEKLTLVVKSDHALSGRNAVELADLKDSRLLFRPYCEQAGRLADLLKSNGIDPQSCHQVSSEADMLSLLQAGVGVGFLPQSLRLPGDLRRLHVSDADLGRTIQLYAVAGRPRPATAGALMSLLRSSDWSHHLH